MYANASLESLGFPTPHSLNNVERGAVCGIESRILQPAYSCGCSYRERSRREAMRGRLLHWKVNRTKPGG